MRRIRHPSKRSSHLTLWLGLVAAAVVMAGFLHYSSVQAEKKKTGNYNYLKSMPSDSMLRAQLKEEQDRLEAEHRILPNGAENEDSPARLHAARARTACSYYQRRAEELLSQAPMRRRGPAADVARRKKTFGYRPRVLKRQISRSGFERHGYVKAAPNPRQPAARRPLRKQACGFRLLDVERARRVGGRDAAPCLAQHLRQSLA